MAEWWENDPVVSDGDDFWSNDPVVEQSSAMQQAMSELSDMSANPKVRERPQEDVGRFPAFRRAVSDAMTLGTGDEVRAAISALLTDEQYSDALDRERGNLAAAREQYPGTTLAGSVVGGLAAPGLGTAGLVGRAATIPGKIAAGAGAGALLGGAYGFASGEGGAENRAEEAIKQGFAGLAVGGAVPAVASAGRAVAERVASSRAAQQVVAAAPSGPDLRAAASRIYDQADQVANLPRQQFAADVSGMVGDATRKGLDADLTPGAAKVASRLTDAAGAADPNIGFRELDILRRKAAIPAGNVTNRTEQSIASSMIEGIDRFIDNADPALSGSIKQARDMWGVLRRSEAIESAIAKARNTASGFENGLRIEFRKILNNPKLMRGFNDTEREAIQSVVRGTAMGNLLRQVGRIGIGLSGQSNGLGATIGGIAGTAAGGPIGGMLAVGAGTGAKALAERTTRLAADRALATVAARNALAGMAPTALPGVENALLGVGFGAVPAASERAVNYLEGLRR